MSSEVQAPKKRGGKRKSEAALTETPHADKKAAQAAVAPPPEDGSNLASAPVVSASASALASTSFGAAVPPEAAPEVPDEDAADSAATTIAPITTTTATDASPALAAPAPAAAPTPTPTAAAMAKDAKDAKDGKEAKDVKAEEKKGQKGGGKAVTVTSRKPRETKEVPDGLVINTHGKAWVFIDQEELSTLGAKSRMMNIKRTTHNMMAKLQGLLSVLKMLVVHNPEAAKIKKSFETVRQRLEVNNNIVLENQVSESEVQGDPINKGHEKAMLTMSMSYCMQEFQRELANLCIQITNDAHEHKKLNDTCDYIRLVFDEIRRDLITTRNDADELLTAVEQVGAQKNVHAALPFLNFVTVLPSAPRLLALQAK